MQKLKENFNKMNECLSKITNQANKNAWEKLIEMFNLLECQHDNEIQKKVETIFTECKKAVENYV